ncbi:MAG: carbohydrate porin [Candidatus Omnitrophica bacterium]|nr:carbohydrate porin [Candidatus Omnitrophota bacterium]
MKTLAIPLIFIFCLFSAQAYAAAPSNADLLKEIESLKGRVAELEARLTQKEAPSKKEEAKPQKETEASKPSLKHIPGQGYAIEPGGIVIKPSGTLVVQATPDPNRTDTATAGGSYVFYIDFLKQIGENGNAFFRLEPGDGNTIEDDLTVFSNVNHNAHDAGSEVSLRKFWYTQYLLDKQLRITCGKLDAAHRIDQNVYANNDDTKFLADIFNNSPAIEWPADYSLSLNTIIAPEKMKFLEFALNYFDGDAEWSNIFDHAVYAAQVNIMPGFFSDSVGPTGNYRFYAWLNSRNHAMLVDVGQPANTDKKHNYGFGLSLDQPLNDIYGIFGRIGWQRPDLIPAEGGATLEWSWSAGGQMMGTYWGRKDDFLGLGIGQIFPSEDYEDAGNPGSTEGHAELYYSIKTNDYLTICPDLQLIWNPNGVGSSSEGNDGTIFVYGARAHLAF